MLSKCSCQFCGTHLEFEVEHANQFVPCPNCAKQTRLLVPGGFLPGERPRFNTAQSFKKKWGLSQWFTFVLIALLLVALVYVLCKPAWRTDVIQAIGTGGIYLLGIGVAGLIIFLAYLLIVSGIVLQSIIAALIALGLFLAFEGFGNYLFIQNAKEATVFQQLYAMIELVGGSVVFCAAMILHVLRTRLNAPIKL